MRHLEPDDDEMRRPFPVECVPPVREIVGAYIVMHSLVEYAVDQMHASLVRLGRPRPKSYSLKDRIAFVRRESRHYLAPSIHDDLRDGLTAFKSLTATRDKLAHGNFVNLRPGPPPVLVTHKFGKDGVDAFEFVEMDKACTDITAMTAIGHKIRVACIALQAHEQ